MADSIEQTFGLDASGALAAMQGLDSAFQKFGATLNTLGPSFQTFNAQGAQTVSRLNEIRDAARGAISELSRLSTVAKLPSNPASGGGGRSGGGGAKLLTGDAAAGAFNQLLGQNTGAVSSFGQAAQQGSAGTNAFAVSFQTLSRVIATQVIVRTMSAIRNAVTESVESFIAFNKSIAEIQTIASDSSIQKLGKEVRDLSDEFNAPILDVAKAKYQALSNGFKEGAESTALLNAALKFSKVGISDVTDATNLIGGALNAYGKDISEAENVTAKFIQTIQQGRVVGTDLANAFGRVAPIAKNAGVSMEELLAGFSSITVGGVKASEAATQLRSTIAGLLKPSQEMQAALRQLGYASGEDAIKALGFQGALEALKGTTDGSISSLEKLFPNIRAISGVLREVTTGADVFKEHLEANVKAASEILNKKFKLRVESDGEKVAADINKIKNALTVDLGGAVTENLKSLFSGLGGIDNVVAAVKTLAPTLFQVTTAVGLATAGFYAWTAASKALHPQLFLVNAAGKQCVNTAGLLGSALTGVIAVMLAIDVGQIIGQRFLDGLEKGYNDAKNKSDQFLQHRQDQRSAESQLTKAAADEQIKSQLQASAALNKENNEEIDDAKEKDEALLESTKSTTDKLIAIRSKYGNDLATLAQKAENNVIQSKKKSVEIQGEYEDLLFNIRQEREFRGQNSRGALSQKAEQDRAQALKLSQQGFDALSKAKTPDQHTAGEKEFARAEAYAKQAIETAKSAHNLQDQQDAENSLLRIVQQRGEAEKNYQATQHAVAVRAEQASAEEKKRVTDLRSAQKKLLDDIDLFSGKKGALLKPEDRAKAIADANKQRDIIVDKAFGKGGKGDADIFGFDKALKDALQGVTKPEIKGLIAAPDSLKDINTQIQGNLSKVSFFIEHLGISEKGKQELRELVEKGLSGQVTSTANKLVEDQEQQRQKLEKDQAAIKQGGLASGLARQNAIEATDTSGEGFRDKANRGIALAIGNLLHGQINPFSEGGRSGQEVKSIRDQLTEYLKSGGKIDEKVLKTLAEDAAKASGKGGVQYGGDTQAIVNAIKSLLQGIEAEKAVAAAQKANPTGFGELPVITDRQQQGGAAARYQLQQRAFQEEAERRAKEAQLKNSVNKGADNAEPASRNLASATEEAAAAAARYASNMEAGAAAANQAATASARVVPPDLSSPFSQNKAYLANLANQADRSNFDNYDAYHSSQGGIVPRYLAKGGFAQGTDMVPAMLTPGERVTDPHNATKFFSQLNAIGAGNAPTSQRGQSGDNFHIGDIHINGAGNPKATAREVINQIRREQRRGSGYQVNANQS